MLESALFVVVPSYQTGRDATGIEAVAAQQSYAMAGYLDDPSRRSWRARRSATPARLLGRRSAWARWRGPSCAGLTVTWMIDRPFNDRGAMISPSRMEAVLVLMERTAPSPIPCDRQGNPVGT